MSNYLTDLNEVGIYQKILFETIKASGMGPQLVDDDIMYINRGQEKFVYSIPKDKVRFPEQQINGDRLVAFATPINSTYDLYSEFQKLKEISSLFGNKFTPLPGFFHEGRNAKIMAMECLDMTLIGKFVKDNLNNPILKKLAYAEGQVIGKIYNKTGLIYVEPHDENIMVSKTDEKIDVKFIDVIHFEKGTKNELIDIFLKKYSYDRIELEKYKNDFLCGLNTMLKN